MFTLLKNHDPFEPLTKNCPKLDNNKSIVSRFPDSVHKSGVGTDISKLAGSKLTTFRVCLSSLQYTPLQD